MTNPSRADVEAALDELVAAQRAVTREGRRGLPVTLTACSVLVVLDYAAKDHVVDRGARRAVSTLCAAGALAITLLDQRASPVQPLSVDPADLGPRAAAPGLALAAGWAITERALITGFRRSRLGRPNTVAGVALAILRPALYLAARRLMPTPRLPMTDPAPDGRLETLLLDPTRLRVAAALQAAGEVEFSYVRDRVGLTDAALSKQIGLLADAELVDTRRGRTGVAGRRRLRLTPHGRQRLAEHAETLRRIVNADS